MAPICILTSSCGTTAADAARTDLSNAGIVGLSNDSIPATTAAMLSVEVEIRTGIRLSILNTRPEAGSPFIQIYTLPQSETLGLPAGLDLPNAADGYTIWIDESGRDPGVMLLGHDDRATLLCRGPFSLNHR